MIINIIIVIISTLFLAFIVNTITDIIKNKNIDKISFKEIMDLTGLPIITFQQGECKLNFILDTGAFNSIIDSRVLNRIKYTSTKGCTVCYGIDGKEHYVNSVEIILTYRNKEYTDVFRLLDMSSSFDKLKQDYGVTVHGLLSSAFFEKYKYVLDFKELIAYIK